MDSGSIIRWREKGHSHGLIIEVILDTMLMIRSKDMGCSSGLMEEGMREIGLMGSSMGKVCIFHHKGLERRVSGRKEGELVS